jgi:hypothetical protein
MKDAVVVLGKDDDQIPCRLQEPAAPALPADGPSPGVLLLTQPPLCGRQGKHQQGEHHVHAHRPRGFLGRMPQTPRLLTLFDTAILNETTSVVIIKGPQRLLHGGVRQQDRFARRVVLVTMPLADH